MHLLVVPGVACLAAAGLAFVAFVSNYLELDGANGIRIRLVFAGQQVSLVDGFVILVGAILLAVARADRRLRFATAVVGALLGGAVSAGSGIVLFWWSQPISGLHRGGYAVSTLGTIALCALASWIATGPWSAEAVADAAGEAPDGGVGGGDLVGESQGDRLFRP